MIPYSLSIPTKIYFGRNILQEALAAEKKSFPDKVLIVTTGRSLIRLGHLDRLKILLKTVCEVENIYVFDKISANPLVSEVEEGISLGKQENVSVVIGFGGGSALDAAKAVAAGIGMEVSCRQLFDGKVVPSEATLPIIAIPTTAGTGSELSKAAILSDSQEKIKKGIRGGSLFPKIAIVDSFFTETIPHNITMQTGFDALAHAIESFLSKASSPYTRMLSEKAIEIVGENLPRLVLDGNNQEARKRMSFASMIMGINLGNASTCLPHRLQYPIGAHTNTSHGSGLAALYPAWLYYESDVSLDGLKHIMNLLGFKQVDSKDSIVRMFVSFLKRLDLPVSLKEIGIQKQQLDIFVEGVTGNIQNDPVGTQDEIIKKIYYKAF